MLHKGHWGVASRPPSYPPINDGVEKNRQDIGVDENVGAVPIAGDLPVTR